MDVTNHTKAVAQSILRYIEMYPERHDQRAWVSNPDGTDNHEKFDSDNVCNTTMCIAGTAVFLTRPVDEFKRFDGDWESVGGGLLGLTYDEAEQLFYADNETSLKMLRAVAEGNEEEFYRIISEEYKVVA